jgi:rhodanese-related sulfurtransferase
MDKRLWIQCAAVLALTLVGSVGALADETPTTLAGVKVVSAEEARKLQADGALLIDTRDYAPRTAAGAISVPYKEKSAREEGFDPTGDTFDLGKLPTDKAAPVVFFCNAGECWKSYKASVVALKLGYTQIYWMRGGYPEWAAQGLPTQETEMSKQFQPK